MKNYPDAYFVGLKDKAVNGIKPLSFSGKKPVQIVGSGNHWAFIDEIGRGYGFGCNSSKEISSKMGDKIDTPYPIEFNEKLYEIACGNGFTVAIDQKMQVLRRGKNIEHQVYGKYSAPRSISAFGDNFCFAFETNKLMLVDKKGASTNLVIDGSLVSIISCVLNNQSIAVLDSDGSVTLASIESPSRKNKLDLQNITAIYASTNCFLLIEKKYNIYIVGENKKICTMFVPPGFIPVYGNCERQDVFLLDINGRIAHGLVGYSEVRLGSTFFNSIEKIPLGVSFNSFCLLGENPLFIRGTPQLQIAPNNSINSKSGTAIKLPSDDYDIFYAATESTAFLKDTRIETSLALRLVQDDCFQMDDIFYTSTYREIKLDTTNSIFGVNLLPKDTILIKNKTKAIVEGIAEGYVWVSFDEIPLVTAACLATLNDVCENIEVVERKNHKLQNIISNGVKTAIDVTEKFVESFGYSIGDLVWAGTRGVCEVVGVAGNMLALLDQQDNTIFLGGFDSFKVLRRVSSKLHHTRDVITIEGKKVTLDISADGPRLFVPTDRVMSPHGYATFLGFADTAYIQTDEMRMNGYEAIAVDIKDLKLIRRISMPAKRRFRSNDKVVDVSIDTRSGSRVLPGDVILVNNSLAIVIGYNDKGFYAATEGGKDPFVISEKDLKDCQIVYRSDINATRTLGDITVQVGSPGISEAIMLPGDLVNAKEVGDCTYVGYNDNSMVFLLQKTGNIMSFSFSACLLPELFRVSTHTALSIAL